MKKTILFTVALFSFMLNFLCLNAQWEKTNFPQDAGSVFTFAISGNNIFAGTESRGILLSTDNGESWVEKNNGLTNLNIRSLAVSGNDIFAGTDGDGVFFSTDNGGSWIEKNNGITHKWIDAFTPTSNNIFAVSGYGIVYLSTDNGDNWTYRGNESLSSRDGLCFMYVSFAISSNNLFYGSCCGFYLSTDNGISWSYKENGLPEYNCINIFANQDNEIYCGTLDGVFLSTDNGNSWVAKNYGLTNLDVRSIAISGNNIFVGGGGVFLSIDNGESWVAKNYGLSDKIVFSLAISGEYIFAGIENGVYRAKISDLISTSVDDEKHSEFALSIAPNPIDDITAISFNLEEANIVSVQITDLLGNVIADVIIDKFIEAGKQKIEFDSKNLPSGTYFCTIKAGNHTETVKFVVLK